MTRECRCHETADYLDQRFEAGSVRGLRFRLRDVRVQPSTRTEARATVTFDVSAYEELDESGQVTESIRGYKNAKDGMTLRLVDGQWLVADVARIRLGE
jgi:hypothetical protein